MGGKEKDIDKISNKLLNIQDDEAFITEYGRLYWKEGFFIQNKEEARATFSAEVRDRAREIMNRYEKTTYKLVEKQGMPKDEKIKYPWSDGYLRGVKSQKIIRNEFNDERDKETPF